MDWKFTFNILSDAFSFVRLFFFLSGVDACIGLMLFDGVGLAHQITTVSCQIPLASPTPSNNIRPIHASTPDRKKNRRTKENASLRILNVNFPQSVWSSRTDVTINMAFTAIRTPPPPQFLFLRKMLQPEENIWLSLMFESIHVSVPKIMSGFVLSIRFHFHTYIFIITSVPEQIAK
jgi:hypothetical protein